MHKILRYTKFSETPKCSPTKFIRTVWQKVFDGERDTPLSDAQNFSIPEIFRYTEVFPNEIFGTVRAKGWTKNRDTPPSFV